MADAGMPLDMALFIPAIASYYSDSKGNLAALPFNSSSPVLYYNKDALKKAGYDPEAPFPKTWPEVIEMARKIKASGTKYGISTNWLSWIQLENLSTLHNVPFASKGNGLDGFDAVLEFNSPFHLKHIEMLKTLHDEGVFLYAGAQSPSVFYAGDMGILPTLPALSRTSKPTPSSPMAWPSFPIGPI